MNEIIEKKITLKEKLENIFKKNKIKILFILVTLIIFFGLFLFINENKKQKDIKFSEKFIKVNLLLANEKSNDKTNYLLEEIVLSGSKFYSPLALNLILEKNLIQDKEKILKYFSIIENLSYSQELSDLILFKKALYLIKIKENEIGNEILKKLINKESDLKFAAQELIN